jgi:uncharacterized damage-inducible protein DinB
MTYYGAKELAESFRTVRKNTIIAASEIGEEQYNFSPVPGNRTIAQLLTHIAVTPRLPQQIHRVERLSSLAAFDFPGFFGTIVAEEQKPRTKAELLALLQESGDNLASWLEGLSEEFLGETVTFPAGMTPPVKTRFEMLLGIKEHEMHHRAQLMLMSRMVGVVPHLTRAMMERMAAMQQAEKATA